MSLAISAVIMLKNNEKQLPGLLESLQSFDEIVVVDTGSEDRTREIAQQDPKVSLHCISFHNFGQARREAVNCASFDWIFMIDSDELPSPELLKEISNLSLKEDTVYRIARKNFYKGKWIYSSNWYPDSVVRLFNRGKTNYDLRENHEKVDCSSVQVQKLSEHLYHYSHISCEDFLRKLPSYTTFSALQNYKDGKRSSVFGAFFRACFTFIISYVIKGGIFQGAEGLEIAVYRANLVFYKYVKLAEME